MKAETQFTAPPDGREAATRIAVPRPMHDGVGNALRSAYPAPPDERAHEFARLLERLH